MTVLTADAVGAPGYPQTINLDIPQRQYPLPNFPEMRDVGYEWLQAEAGSSPVPVTPKPATLPAWETRLSFHDWYYRIHFVPMSIEFGSVTNDQVRAPYIWNAFFQTKTINSVSIEQNGGIGLSVPVSTPAPLGPLKSLVYQVSVSAEGPAAVEGVVHWVIDGQEYDVKISGLRRVLFAWGPNWSAQMTDTLTWATSLTRTWSGREQRMKLARRPRRAIRYTARLLRGAQTQVFDSDVFGWQGRLFLVPLWQEGSSLTAQAAANTSVLQLDTTGMTLEVGRPVLLYISSETTELIEVAGFTATTITLGGLLQRPWPVGARVFPCVDALPIGRFSTTRQLPTHADMNVAFTANPAGGMLRDNVGTIAHTYRGIEAFYEETDWSNGINASLEPNAFNVDNGMATIQAARRSDFPLIDRTVRWLSKSRVQGNELRQFFCRRAGRFRPVWLPSGTDDFTLIDPIETISTSIVVRSNDYTGLVRLQPGRRDIVLLLRNGERWARRIIDAQQSGDRTVLTLDSGFGQGLLPGDIKRISYLGLYRMADDFVTFNWITDAVSVVETSFVLTEPDE